MNEEDAVLKDHTRSSIQTINKGTDEEIVKKILLSFFVVVTFFCHQ